MSDLGNKKIMSDNIKYYMKIHNKTRTDISNTLNVPYTTVSDWVNGITYPRIDKIEMLSNYFGIEKKDLVEDREKLKQEELNKDYFTDPQEALEYILKVPMVANFGGYDLERMSDDEIIEMANDLLEMIKILGKRSMSKKG